MALRLVKNTQPNDATTAVRVLLLDTPENLGVDFLQALQRQEMKLVFERVNDKEGLFAALKQGSWDILLVCDQVEVPGAEETLFRLKQLNAETAYVVLSKAELSIEMLTAAYRKGIAAVVSARHPEFSLEVFAREAERSRRNLQLRLLNQEKFELKIHCQQLMTGTEEPLAYLQDGIHVFGNDAYLNLLGYGNTEALMFTPFIDIVSSEMRDKTKQNLLDFQHSVRVQPETTDLTIPELFVSGIGAKEGVLQVSAVFKPVVYEGEDCIQVVLKAGNGADDREESAAAEGLGYPLFITHLDNFIAQARDSDSLIGHVAHIRGTGFEHYIAARGFGSLNGKLKALASELKAGLGKEDLLIRFTENSFLIFFKAGTDARRSGSGLQENLGSLLGKFESTLNREAGSADGSKAIVLSHQVVPVDRSAVAAEQLVKGFLMGDTKLPGSEPEVQTNNVIPFADKAQAAKEVSVRHDDAIAGESVEVPIAALPDGMGGMAEPDAAAVAGKSAEEQLQQAQDAEALAAQQRLGAALPGNALALMYEVVISVADIETEFHDVGLYLQEGLESLDRSSLGATLNASVVAGKLDLWALRNTLAVISGEYKQGQEYRVLLSLSARSLANNRLPELIRNELKAYGLPGEMLIIDFSIDDLNSDPARSGAQLAKLKNEGVALCISDVYHIKALKELLRHVRVDMVRLQKTFVEQGGSADSVFSLLKQSVEKLHSLKMKVVAGDIHNHDELSVCFKAGIDLVKGTCIQKNPLVLNGDSLADEIAI